MSQSPEITSAISPEAAPTAQAAFQEWQQGNQVAAIDRVRAFADRGEPWAIAFVCWMYAQQGVGAYPSAVPYARRAQALGMPWVATNLVNNMFGNLPSAPDLLEPALELLTAGPLIALGFDPAGQAWNMLSQNRADVAVRLLSLRGPYPQNAEAWAALLNDAQSHVQQINGLLENARAESNRVRLAAEESVEAINRHRTDLETTAGQARLLVSSVNSEAINALFKADATKRAGESKIAWRWGIAILGVAAGVAVLPLLLHYLNAGPKFTGNGLFAAHATSTAALATVAGVLLARARGRDRAAQRASDLSTAMGTMIAYSNQISDEAEKQKFMFTMGQLVLQAHLQPDLASKDDPWSGLASLASALRGPGNG